MLRPVLAGKVTMLELRSLRLVEIADWHEMLDLMEEIERLSN
jgi:hypothetical protein